MPREEFYDYGTQIKPESPSTSAPPSSSAPAPADKDYYSSIYGTEKDKVCIFSPKFQFQSI
jgi:hypothetical protein